MNNSNHSKGCGIQCISKVTGVVASKIREVATCNYPSHKEVVSILKRIGYSVKTPFDPRLKLGKVYIATVPSLNYNGEFHFVVLWLHENKSGFVKKVFDPTNDKKKNRYVNSNKSIISRNEFRIVSWTSLIEISK